MTGVAKPRFGNALQQHLDAALARAGAPITVSGLLRVLNAAWAALARCLTTRRRLPSHDLEARLVATPMPDAPADGLARLLAADGIERQRLARDRARRARATTTSWEGAA